MANLIAQISILVMQMIQNYKLRRAAGDDGNLLSVGLAIEKVVVSTAAPPKMPPCRGCRAKVEHRTPTKEVTELEPDSRTSAHLAAEELSIYSLSFEGSCDYLTAAAKERSEL